MFMYIDKEIILHKENSFLHWSGSIQLKDISTSLLFQVTNVWGFDNHVILFEIKKV